jgi:hypothetical protein
MPYTRTHFLSMPPATIDYSPYQPAAVVTLILDADHLRDSSYSQFERFWRVWYTERSFYAPALQTLVLGLRGPRGAATRYDDGSAGQRPADVDGIARFIAYFHTDVYPYAGKVGLDVYHLDNNDMATRLFRILPDGQTPPTPRTWTDTA